MFELPSRCSDGNVEWAVRYINQLLGEKSRLKIIYSESC